MGSGFGIRDEKIPDTDPESGMNISYQIYESLDAIFRLKILYLHSFFADPDPGSGIILTLDLGTEMENFRAGIQFKHPGSATLSQTVQLSVMQKLFS
jgi:hypothetical protein